MSSYIRSGWLTPAHAIVLLLAVGVAWAGDLSGSVTKNSSALPDAYVDVIDSGGGFREEQTAPDGSYFIPGLAAGNADIYCYAPDGTRFIGHQVKNIPSSGSATCSFDWSVGDVWGIVKKNGNTLANARIRLIDKNNNWYDAYTNTQGAYSIPDVTAGTVGAYCFDTDGTPIGYRTGSVGRASNVEISFNTWFFGSVAVHVSRGGTNYANARVDVRDAMGSWKQGYTNASGIATLNNVAVGAATVYIYSAEGWLLSQQTVQVVQDQTANVSFNWAAGTVDVTVLRNGQPLENAYVELGPTSFAYTDADGQCSIDIEAGHRTVRVYQNAPGSAGHGYLIEAREVDLLTGQVLNEVFDWRCGTVQGRVTMYMSPLAGAYVGVDGRGFVLTDASGNYQIDLTAGANTLAFYSPDPHVRLMGTWNQPVAEAAAYTVDFDWRASRTTVSGVISSNTTWTLENSPYEVTGDITVNSGVTLAIEPGVRIYFGLGTGITVNGVLAANGGTDADSIYFGSVKELSSPYVASPGDWRGIAFSSGASTSSMIGCRVAYAGAGTAPASIWASDTTALNIANCDISLSAKLPISLHIKRVGSVSSNTGTGNLLGDDIEVRGSGELYDLSPMTWKYNGLSYRVVGSVGLGSSVSGAALTIEPGVTVKFASAAGMWFTRSDGYRPMQLIAEGTADQPIRFVALSGASGGWAGLNLNKGCSSSVLRHCVIENGGGSGWNARISDCAPLVENCTFKGSAQHGLYLYNSNATITNCQAIGNTKSGIYLESSNATITNCQAIGNTEHGIRVASGSPTFQNLTASGNIGAGVYTEGAARASIISGTFNSNGTYPVSCYINAVGPMTALSGTGNASGDDIEVRGSGELYDLSPMTWRYNGLSYRVVGSVGLGSGVSGAALTIEPGVTVKFASAAGMWFTRSDGYRPMQLIAEGTADQPIRFVALSGASGGWAGLNLNKGCSSSVLRHCVIENGGGSGWNARISDCAPLVENCTFKGSAQHGLYLYNSNATITNCQAIGNTKSGLYLYNSNPAITGCEFLDGKSDGLYVDDNSSPTLSNLRFARNAGGAINIPLAKLSTVTSCSGADGPGDFIMLRVSEITQNLTLNNISLPGLGFGFPGSVMVRGGSTGRANAATLTISAGVKLRFRSGSTLVIGHPSYDCWGALRVLGVSDSPVTLMADSGNAGGWNGIVFNSRTATATGYPDVRHCIIVGGGGDPATQATIQVNSVSPSFVNCTIARGLANGVVLNSSSAHFKNCIISRNSNIGLKVNSGSPVVTYTDLWGNEGGNYSGFTPGVGCISSDPLFVDYFNHDYRLQFPGSPCIDAGDPSMLDLAPSRIDMGAYSTGNPMPPSNPGLGKSQPDGTQLVIPSALVSGIYDSSFYIQDSGRANGLRVLSADPVRIGDEVTVSGVMGTLNGERHVSASQVRILSSGNPAPRPLHLNNKNIGGAAFGWAPGMDGGFGLNNVGLLGRTSGWVTAVAADGFYIDDGSRLQADNGITGIKVVTTGLLPGTTFTSPLVGRHVTVTGCVGAGSFDGRYLPVIRVRGQSDLKYNPATLYFCDFEAGMGDWTPVPGSALMPLTNARYHSPVTSAFASSSAVSAMRRTPERAYPERVFASCWIYDSGGSGTHYLSLRALDTGGLVKDWFSAGIYSPANTGKYCIKTYAQNWWATSVNRSVGWHEFRIEVRPFTGTDDVWFFVDGNLVGKGKRSVNWVINDIQLGAAGVNGGLDAFYDDVCFGLLE